MSEQDRAVQRAVNAFAVAHHVAHDAVALVDVDRAPIPNPPTPPDTAAIMPVRYRYFVTMRAGDVSERFRVEGDHVYRA